MDRLGLRPAARQGPGGTLGGGLRLGRRFARAFRLQRQRPARGLGVRHALIGPTARDRLWSSVRVMSSALKLMYPLILYHKPFMMMASFSLAP